MQRSRKAQKKKQRRGDGTSLVLCLFFVLVCLLVAGSVLTQGETQSFVAQFIHKIPTSTSSTVEPILPHKNTSVAGPFFYLFVVLDDAGAALEHLEPFYTFPEFNKLTFAILPHLVATHAVIGALSERETPYILHMPMQPLGLQDPGPFALRTEYPASKIAALAEKNMEALPGLIGVNNHMGSAATQDKALMHTMLKLVKKRGLFFMDSRTSPRSVVPSVARRVQVPFVTRDVFLDNEENILYIRRKLQEAVTLARTQGFAVAIGHATKSATAEVLKASYKEIKAQGAAFASLREYFLLTR